MTLGGLLSRAIACSLALLLAATLATWVASGDALRAIEIGAPPRADRTEAPGRARPPDALRSFGDAASRVGYAIWSPARTALQILYLVGAVLLLCRGVARRRRGHVGRSGVGGA